MARKVNLSRAMRTMQELFPEEYNFYPRSWILPEEFAIFLTEVGGGFLTRVQRPGREGGAFFTKSLLSSSGPF